MLRVVGGSEGDIKGAMFRLKDIALNPAKYNVDVEKIAFDQFFLGEGYLSYKELSSWKRHRHKYYPLLDEGDYIAIKEMIRVHLESGGGKAQVERWSERYGPVVEKMEEELNNESV